MRLTREHYTAGWISALPKEQAACRLDEYHEALPGQKYETTYVLGRLSQHNVVLACLPATGTNAAAQCAAKLQASFPNLRFLFMVGIGGGVPTRHDIRLGDVVVSMPTKRYPSICQYDFGTKTQGEPLHILPCQGRPPDLLVTAVTALQTKYMHMESRNALGRALSQYIEHLATTCPDMSASQKPGLDELYEPTYVHRDSDLSCEDCECDEDRQVARPSRGRDIHPRVHQGIIASGNAVMRDALERDRLAHEMDVLCFEMEGGGLTADSSLGCLVVRGICDYCDTHKNKGWQEYAAAVAAAYARQLLTVIAPLRLPHCPPQQDDSLMKVLEWLSGTDYAGQQTDLWRKRHPNTGQWFLNAAEVRRWVEERTMVLFCPGSPGSGKTFIFCAVVQHLLNLANNSSDVGVAYFYCNYKRKREQSIEAILACLLRQLLSFRPHVPSTVENLYERHRPRNTGPSVDEYKVCLRDVLSQFSRAYILVDALDELGEEATDAGRLVSMVLSLMIDNHTHVLATSRPLPVITHHFELSVHCEITAHAEDLVNFVQSELPTFAACVRRDVALQEEICRTLVRACDEL